MQVMFVFKIRRKKSENLFRKTQTTRDGNGNGDAMRQQAQENGTGTGKVTIGTGYRYRTPRLPAELANALGAALFACVHCELNSTQRKLNSDLYVSIVCLRL